MTQAVLGLHGTSWVDPHALQVHVGRAGMTCPECGLGKTDPVLKGLRYGLSSPVDQTQPVYHPPRMPYCGENGSRLGPPLGALGPARPSGSPQNEGFLFLKQEGRTSNKLCKRINLRVGLDNTTPNMTPFFFPFRERCTSSLFAANPVGAISRRRQGDRKYSTNPTYP